MSFLDTGEARLGCQALALSNHFKPDLVGVCSELDGLRFTLSIENCCFLSTGSGEHRCLLLAVGPRNRRLLVALGLCDRCPPVALGAHLGVHRGHDVWRRIDALDLDANYSHSPLVSCIVKYLAELCVDGVA